MPDGGYRATTLQVDLLSACVTPRPRRKQNRVAVFLRGLQRAREACIAVHGEQWHLMPEVTMWVRLPASLGRVGRPRLSNRCDYKAPIAKYWVADPLTLIGDK